MSKNLKMTFGYHETEDTRGYNFAVADSVTAADAKAAILAVNASLTAGTDGGLSSFFVSDAGDYFTLITDAQLETVNKTVLDLNIGGDSAASIS